MKKVKQRFWNKNSLKWLRLGVKAAQVDDIVMRVPGAVIEDTALWHMIEWQKSCIYKYDLSVREMKDFTRYHEAYQRTSENLRKKNPLP